MIGVWRRSLTAHSETLRVDTKYRLLPPTYSLHMLPFAHRKSVGSQAQRIGHACRFKRVCVPRPNIGMQLS